MVNIGVGKDCVVIALDAKEKLLAIKRKIAIRKKSIVSVSTENVRRSWLSFMIGIHLPRGFIVGAFWTKKGMAFYYVRDFSKCVTLHLKDHEYSKVVIQVHDKETVTKDLENVL